MMATIFWVLMLSSHGGYQSFYATVSFDTEAECERARKTVTINQRTISPLLSGQAVCEPRKVPK